MAVCKGVDPRLESAIVSLIPTAQSLGWAHCLKSPPGTDLSEMQSIAQAALVEAASRWVSPYCEERNYCPWSEDGSEVNRYFIAYALRRMRGALADHARAADWMTRNMRNRIKVMTAARDAGAHSEEDLVAAAGLTVKQIREADAAQYRRPVSMELERDLSGDFGDTLAAPGADVEEQVVGSSILAAFLAAYAALDTETQVILALRYSAELDFEVIAKELRTSEERVTEAHNSGVLAIHDELLRAASAG